MGSRRMTSQSSKPRTAFICKSMETLAILEKDGLPEGAKGFPVMDSMSIMSSIPHEFDRVFILFEPTTEEEIRAVLHWFFCLKSTRESFDLMDNFVREHDCIVHMEMGDIG